MNDSFFSGWSFRTSYPTFSVGDILQVHVGDYDNDSNTLEVRVGDTLLEVDGGGPEKIDERIRIKVTEFYQSDHTGKAELLGILDTEEF